MPPRMAPGARDATGKSEGRSSPASSRARDPVTGTERDRMRVMHSRGMSCREIARELGRAPVTVSRQIAAMGLSFDREQTREATSARVDDMKAQRSRIMQRLLDEAEAELNARDQDQPDHAFTPAGEAVRGSFLPRPQDRMYLARSATSLLAEHRHMAQLDAEDEAAGAKSMLAALAAGLAAAAGAMDGDDG